MLRILVVAVLAWSAGLVDAQTTWTPSSNVWNTSGNWSAGIPGIGQTAQFDNAPIAANRLLTFSADAVAGNINFTVPIGTTYTFTSTTNSLTLNNAGSGSAISVPAATTVNIDFNMAVNLTDAGGTTITNNGTGILRFNTSGTQATTIGSAGVVFAGSGGFQMSNTGDVAGSGNITMNGTGTFTMGSGNTWTGKLILNNGIFSYAADSAFGAIPGALVPDAITLNGGTLTATSTTTINANRGVTLGSAGGTIAGTSTTTVSNITGGVGSGALTKAQSGTLTLPTANSFPGGMSITGGRVNFNASGSAGSGTITVTPASTVTIADAVGGTTLTNNVVLNSSANTIDIFNSGSTGSVFTLSGNITGNGNLSRGVGGGTQLVALTGDNSGWSGNLILVGNSGTTPTPIFIPSASFGSGNIQLGTTTFQSVLLTNGTFARDLGTTAGQVQWVGTGTTGLAARGGPLTVTFNSGASLTWGSGNFVQTGQALALGAANFADNVVTLANAIDFGATQRTINVVDNTNSSADRGRLAGNLTGSAGLTKTGSGILELVGSNSSLSGPYDISGGTLAFSNASNVAGATFIGSTATGSILQFEGTAFTSVAPGLKLTSSGAVNVVDAGATLAFVNAGTGTAALTKAGLGTLLFSVPFSGSASATTINSGTLTLGGTGGRSAGTGAITVNAGAQLFLDSFAANETTQDRVAGGVVLNSGDLRLRGNASATTSETLTTLTASVLGTVTLELNDSPSLTLNVTTYTAPSPGNLIVFRSPSLGGSTKAILNIGTSALVTNALGDASLTGNGNFFLQHDNTNGVQEVAYTTGGDIDNIGIPTPTTANFRNTGGVSNTVGAANTIATLTLNGTSPTINIPSGTLTISSGGILTQTLTTGATITGANLASSAFSIVTNSDLTISSQLVTTGGVSKSGIATLTLTRPLPNAAVNVFGGTLNVTSPNPSTIASLVVGTGASFNHTGNLTVNSTAAQTIPGTVAIAGNYTHTGFSQTFTGNFSVNGNVQVVGTTLIVQGSSAVFNTPASGTVAASAQGGTAGLITFDHASIVSIPNRAPNAPSVVLNASRLTLNGSTTAGSNTDQTFGALRGSGFSVLTIPTVAATSNVLRFASLSNDPNVGWYFHGGTGLGAGAPAAGRTNFFFATPPTLSTTGGGLPGTNTVSIVPGVVADITASLGTLNGNLGTYTSTEGLRALTAAEQQSGFSGSTINTNVIFTAATTLPAGTTFANSVVNAGSGVALNGTSPGSTLVIGSGTFLYQFGSATPGFGSLLTLNMNGNRGTIIFTGSASAMIINSAITNTNSDGLVINTNQVSGGITLGSIDPANNFPALTINAGRGSSTSTTLINTNFSADANLGATNGRITLNYARLTYTSTTTPLTLNRALRIGDTAEFSVTTTSTTFSGANSAFQGFGTLTKVGTGTLNLTPTTLQPGNLNGTPATLGFATTAGTGSLNLSAASNYSWKLRGSPGNYSNDLVQLGGTTTLTINPNATITLDLFGIDPYVLGADMGGIGSTRDYVVIDALPTNTANFAVGQINLINAAPEFNTSNFQTLNISGDVVLRFTAPVPEPGLLLVAVAGGVILTRRRFGIRR